ncbi:50S ribosomal protein L13 [Enterobacteriaceae endosymbiont of Macroplea mutica]|uniref:50S ribosomal protein L13 n=1 Tax=Enterobacteriaceae endosymbiont of Macroplea mutica TaxID=2675791 RepID=UPI00144914EF|nr:50S ribosomal protein L13 [Enterobacteriaceae endosymbiont of Macroplea mutica]QJC31440.1 50S ribosomal protein L13 [Enterobacteriaceae endosymbiont of Macroplea mutica]
MSNNTVSINNNHRSWYLINAKEQILGRLATKIVYYLIGKHKVAYTPSIDIGDYVIVINAQKINITGNKRKNKFYFSHSGYSGGFKKISFEKLISINPQKIIHHAVKGMLPKNKIGCMVLKRLKIYADKTHQHQAQQHIHNI